VDWVGDLDGVWRLKGTVQIGLVLCPSVEIGEEVAKKVRVK